MEHKGTKTIETERLLLRQFNENDADAMFRNWESDDKVTEFLRWKTVTDISTAEQILCDWIQEYNNSDFYQWAFKAIIPFFFEEVGVNRIESQHDPNNPNSGKVMQKCGLKYEGTLRQADWNNKGIVDACMYSLLKSEWEEER